MWIPTRFHITQVIVNYNNNFDPTSFEVDSNTVSLWKFNEGSGNILYDHSGNGNHGTIYGARWITNETTKYVSVSASGEIENGSLLSAQRQFVIQLYLNDEFDGGETEFLYQNKREKAVAGDVIIFPCGYTHTHRGNAPIGGTKYLATSWGWIQGSEEDEY